MTFSDLGGYICFLKPFYLTYSGPGKYSVYYLRYARTAPGYLAMMMMMVCFILFS